MRLADEDTPIPLQDPEVGEKRVTERVNIETGDNLGDPDGDSSSDVEGDYNLKLRDPVTDGRRKHKNRTNPVQEDASNEP